MLAKWFSLLPAKILLLMLWAFVFQHQYVWFVVPILHGLHPLHYWHCFAILLMFDAYVHFPVRMPIISILFSNPKVQAASAKAIFFSQVISLFGAVVTFIASWVLHHFLT